MRKKYFKKLRDVHIDLLVICVSTYNWLITKSTVDNLINYVDRLLVIEDNREYNILTGSLNGIKLSKIKVNESDDEDESEDESDE